MNKQVEISFSTRCFSVIFWYSQIECKINHCEMKVSLLQSLLAKMTNTM